MIKPLQTQQKILLHSCCAPCSCSIIKRMLDLDWQPTVFFYNPNIYPPDEYEKRKSWVIRYTIRVGVPFIDADYELPRWFETVRGFEEEPEKGKRCDLCFEMRFGKTAAYAAKHGFHLFTSSLGISRWKDLEQVNRAGIKASRLFRDLTYLDMNWRENGGTEMMNRIIKEQGFYRQNYCGCLYSLRRNKKK